MDDHMAEAYYRVTVIVLAMLLPRRFSSPLTVLLVLFNVYLGKVADFYARSSAV